MTALLDLPAIRKHMATLSVESYHRLGELPVELLKGTIIEKMAKSPLHQYYVKRLGEIISRQVSPGYTVWQERPLTFSDSEPEPDVSVVTGTAEDYLRAHPTTAELVVEVSVSSLEIDHVKAQIYAEAGVKEYWIVCPEERRVEVYREPSLEGYKMHTDLTPPAVLTCAALSGLSVNLETLFV